jgi:hypothetical protein
MAWIDEVVADLNPSYNILQKALSKVTKRLSKGDLIPGIEPVNTKPWSYIKNCGIRSFFQIIKIQVLMFFVWLSY